MDFTRIPQINAEGNLKNINRFNFETVNFITLFFAKIQKILCVHIKIKFLKQYLPNRKTVSVINYIISKDEKEILDFFQINNMALKK